MAKITQAEEKLKKIAKSDVIWLFKSIMADSNLMKGKTINLLSAHYSKSHIHQRYAPMGHLTKALIVKMNTSESGKREYFEFYLVKNTHFSTIYHRSISRVETIESQTKTKKNVKDSVPA